MHRLWQPSSGERIQQVQYGRTVGFGQAAQLTDHPLGREFRILLGFRF